jgi:hypothetical protein
MEPKEITKNKAESSNVLVSKYMQNYSNHYTRYWHKINLSTNGTEKKAQK